MKLREPIHCRKISKNKKGRHNISFVNFCQPCHSYHIVKARINIAMSVGMDVDVSVNVLTVICRSEYFKPRRKITGRRGDTNRTVRLQKMVLED